MAASPHSSDPRSAHEARDRIRAIQQRQEQAARQRTDHAAAREAAQAAALAEAETARLRARLRSLQEENDALRERLAALVEGDDGIRSVPLEWGLSRQEACLLAAIRRAGRRILTTDAALVALYGDDAERRHRGTPAVLVSRIRRRLRDLNTGIAVETHEQRGYRLAPASIALFDAALTPSHSGGPA